MQCQLFVELSGKTHLVHCRSIRAARRQAKALHNKHAVTRIELHVVGRKTEVLKG